MVEATSKLCEWCQRPFQPRRGGSPQRFCRSKFRTAFWAALRRWGERDVAAQRAAVGACSATGASSSACWRGQSRRTGAELRGPGSRWPDRGNLYRKLGNNRVLEAADSLAFLPLKHDFKRRGGAAV
jgi:hypothetical protein